MNHQQPPKDLDWADVEDDAQRMNDEIAEREHRDFSRYTATPWGYAQSLSDLGWGDQKILDALSELFECDLARAEDYSNFVREVLK